MATCRLASLLIVAHSVSPVRLVFFSESEFMRFTLTGSHSAAWCSHDQGNTSALVSSCRAAVWTVIRVDKLSVWRDSNESRGFVPLLAQTLYRTFIELFISFYRGKLFCNNYRYRIIAQPYQQQSRTMTNYLQIPEHHWQTSNLVKCVVSRAGYRLGFFRYRCQIDTFKTVLVPEPILIKMKNYQLIIGLAISTKHMGPVSQTHRQGLD